MKTRLFKSLGLGIVPSVAIIAPLASVVSCDNGGVSTKEYKILPTYTGQADQLIALGIKADYYPLQLDQKAPFAYLTNPVQYMFGQSDEFKTAFAKKIAALVPDSKGTSWWNQQALQDGEKGSDPEYWQHVKGTLTLYEQYLLDDGAKAVDKSTAPQHTDSPETFIQTNFRESRDPYTRLPKKVTEALLDQTAYDALKAGTSDEEKNAVAFINGMLDVARAIEGSLVGKVKAVDGKDLPSGKASREATDDESWIYNDFVFARSWHTQFMDNGQFQGTSFADWVLAQRNANNFADNWAFDSHEDKDQELASLFFASTYTPQEKSLKLNEFAAQAYGGSGALALHHPIYEQQEDLGGAPMFEGAMRDNSLYLFDLSSKIQNAFTKNPNASGTKFLQAQFAGDSRLGKLEHALDNANLINQQLRARMAAIKTLVDKLDVDHKTFGIVTIAPGGGVSTIQTASKYSFLYKELGFNQPLPNAFPDANDLEQHDGTFKKDSFFNMDDNGWWWNISTPGDDNGISDARVREFSKFNYGVLTANDLQYNTVLKAADKTTLSQLFNGSLDNSKRDYNLWNEGLKTPFVMHMILDDIVNQISADAQAKGATDANINAAKNWGHYFTVDFIK